MCWQQLETKRTTSFTCPANLTIHVDVFDQRVLDVSMEDKDKQDEANNVERKGHENG